MDLDALAQEMPAWRRDLHAHPEFGFEMRVIAEGTALTDNVAAEVTYTRASSCRS